jgi:hypothetical protein
MIKLAELIDEVKSLKCPIATQNVETNLKNRQVAIDRYGYGPLNPNNANVKFWKEKAAMWKLDSVEEAKSAICGNCAAFNITEHMLSCIEKGLTTGEKEVQVEGSTAAEAWDTINAGKLGYCTMHKFKCASARTCDAWITGGPIKDK